MRIRMLVVFFVVALLSPFAVANSGHGGGASAPPMVFTVNLGSSHYLRVELVLEPATPEVTHELDMFRPRIQHAVILLLSERSEDKLRTLAGKKELMEDILDAVNHVIHGDHKTGVKEVLFTSFIIQ